jgi:hypothetical protein
MFGRAGDDRSERGRACDERRREEPGTRLDEEVNGPMRSVVVLGRTSVQPSPAPA